MANINYVIEKKIPDVFHAFLVENANYVGVEEIPCVRTTDSLPKKLISFSKAMNSFDYDSWIHFYEHDYKFERLWNTPQRYLAKIKKFKGIISPDYSLYYNMPFVMQEWNVYRGRALGYWFTINGIKVIPNVRWGDERTFTLSTLGVEKNKTIAVGTHGCLKALDDKRMFKRGFNYVIQKLKPKNVVIYGTMPRDVLSIAEKYNVKLIVFESEFSQIHRNGEK